MSVSVALRAVSFGLLCLNGACDFYNNDLLDEAQGVAQAEERSEALDGHCENRKQDADESDVDCGGLDCSPCKLGRMCAVANDCENESCVLGACQKPTCTDGVKNAHETDVDCGGEACAACAVGARCEGAEDCESSVCQASVCVAATCGDRLQNGGESDVDCGGRCARLCERGASCTLGLDCAQPDDDATGMSVCRDGICDMACAGDRGDCNERAVDGCEVDLEGDPEHCGACGAECDLPHVLVTGCTAQQCSIVVCAEGYMNCNGDPSDGCETVIDSDVDNCGACAFACSSQGGTASCLEGSCQIECDEGAADCDDDARHNGCETETASHALHCSSCTEICETSAPGEVAYCREGVCGATVCEPGWGDCDGDGECTDALDDENHCGGCGLTCALPGGVSTCAAGACAIEECPANRNDCDGIFETGCESDPSGDVDNCGSCGTACGATGENVVGAACVAGDCLTTCSPGFCSGDGPEAACTEALGTMTNCTTCGDECGPGERCTEIGCSAYVPVSVLQQKNFSSSVENGWKSVGTFRLSLGASGSRALVLLAATTVSVYSMDARISWGATNRSLRKELTYREKQSEAGVLALLDEDLPPPGTEITLWFWAADWWGGFVGTLLELDYVDQDEWVADEFNVKDESCPQAVRAEALVARPGSLILAALNVNYDSNRDGAAFGLTEIRDSYQTDQTNGLFGVRSLAMEDATVGWDVQTCWRWTMAGVVVQPAAARDVLIH